MLLYHSLFIFSGNFILGIFFLAVLCIVRLYFTYNNYRWSVVRMERVKNADGFCTLIKNKFSGVLPQMVNSEVVFEGSDNILYCQDGVSLKNVTLRFLGSNSVVFLSGSRHSYSLIVNIFNNSALYFGGNNYFNPYGVGMSLILSEGKNVFFGKNCLFSHGISIRLADPHLIYDVDTKKRINHSKSVFVGDHVWVGQDALILKGTQIGSGSILGANSVISGKKIPSNSSWAGNPARLIRSGVFYSDECVHTWGHTESDKYEYKDSDAFIYGSNAHENLSFDKIDAQISSLVEAKDKLEFLISNICDNTKKNRFYIG